MNGLVRIVPFPDDFEGKGKYLAWDRSWNRTGLRDTPQYPGAQPIRFPQDATPIECFLGGYIQDAGA